jgi:hypothetical protein
MRRSLIYKIIGVAIVLFWVFVLVELVKRTNFTARKAEFTDIDETGSVESDSEQWMDILLKGRKVGYTVTRVTELNGKFDVKEQIFLAVNLMGSTRRIFSTTSARVDEKFLLNSFDFSLSSELIDFKISGLIRGNNLFLSLGEEGKKETKRIRLPSKPMINAGMTQYFRSRRLQVGESFSFPIFDPISMTTNPMIVKVVGREKITLHGETYNAFRLEMRFLGRPLVFWLDEEGRALKEEGFMGFNLVRTTPSKALTGLDKSARIDFYELSAIPVSTELEDPQEVSYLAVLFNQSPPSLPVDGARQILDGKTLEVIRERPPFKASYLVPYQGADGELLKYLKPEMLIQSEDREILSIAKEIVGETAEPFRAAKMIMGWVYVNLEKTPTVSVPDAKQILIQRRGDCNEHATLVAALLRAAGIPARIVVGLVYKDGKFYYHAWNEAYIDRWISMDAILNQMPADATHIKLIDGGIEKQIQIVGMIGNLFLTIVDHR